jgi:dienelactone hydrolase
VAHFSPEIAKALDAPALAAAWDSIIGQYGAFGSIERVEQEEKPGLQVIYLTTVFARGELTLTLVFDSNGHVVSFTATPPQARESWKPPEYAKADSFTERSVTITTGMWQLPGTLTIPSGPGPFPAVVLVHGSGPHDQDESIGPNMTFKDLAWGLASRSVAVLRYEKRTHKYGAKSSADPATLTIADETIDDARSAVALLTATQEIDPKRIYVLGHSLGGYIAPRIATGNTKIAGLVLMAGNTRPVEDLVVEQIRNAVSLGDKVTPEGQKQIEAVEKEMGEWRSPDLKPGMTVHLLGAPVPASYVLDLRGYKPGDTAALLKIPILVLQGERDIQVRTADFEGWKKALTGHANATFKLYPALNHLFMPGTGPSSGSEYQKPNHVSKEVIDDIAAWIVSTTIKKK